MNKVKVGLATAGLVGAGLALALAGGPAWAAKPGGGGGGGGGVDTGTVYATRIMADGKSHVCSMNPDGSAKTVLPVLVWGTTDATRTLHGGHRWFSTLVAVPGETTITGGAKYELSAIRDDGISVRLTISPPEVKVKLGLWGPGDSRIAWQADRWDGARYAPEGVYIADVVYDGSANVVGLAAMPAAPTVATTSWSTGGFDWSPDGTRLVLSDVDQADFGTLRIADLALGTSAALSTAASATEPRWSPNGLWVAYGGLRRVAVDGSGDVQLLVASNGPIKSTAYGMPRWSPNGINLAVYVASRKYPNYYDDVGRCGFNGGTVTILTSDVPTTWTPIAWR